MIIEDEELRTLFDAESREHLQHLDEGLLRLESDPTDSRTLESLFRNAHSLKGAAGMLGVTGVEAVAHRFEDLLSSAKRGEESLTSATLDRMYRALDAIGRLAAEAVTGEPSGVDFELVIQRINEEGVAVPSDTPEQPASPGQSVKAAEGSSGTHKIGTIRVEPQKLDALMTEAGELIVTKTRIAHRTAQVDHILGIWEEWNKSRGRHPPETLGALLSRLRDDIYEDNARLESAVGRLDEGVRVIRLLPFSTIFNLFRRMVRDVAQEQKKEVQLVIDGGSTAADKRILEEMKDPLMHMIRNAVDHGIEKPLQREIRGKPRMGTVRLSAVQSGANIVVEIQDDGQGLSEESIKATALRRKLVGPEELDRMTTQDILLLIFRPGFSTNTVITDISGRGVGMDVVQTNVERLKGSIAVVSAPNAGCTFRIELPATLATSRVLLVAVEGGVYALPLGYIHLTRLLAAEDIFPIEGRESILVDTRPVSVVRLFDLLELRNSAARQGSATVDRLRQSCVILSVADELLAVIVDELLDEQEVILKPHGLLLKRVRNVSGSTILVTGVVCTVLNPLDLIRSARKSVFQVKAPRATVQERVKLTVLLVEDSITTRTWEKRGLEDAGYVVVTAVDGIEALQKLSTRSFDAIVSDIEMPNMDGLTLTEKIRQSNRHKELPVILVTSLADEADKKRGIEAGANAYISKAAFDQKLLIETLERLV